MRESRSRTTSRIPSIRVIVNDTHSSVSESGRRYACDHFQDSAPQTRFQSTTCSLQADSINPPSGKSRRTRRHRFPTLRRAIWRLIRYLETRDRLLEPKQQPSYPSSIQMLLRRLSENPSVAQLLCDPSLGYDGPVQERLYTDCGTVMNERKPKSRFSCHFPRVMF